MTKNDSMLTYWDAFQYVGSAVAVALLIVTIFGALTALGIWIDQRRGANVPVVSFALPMGTLILCLLFVVPALYVGGTP